MAQSTAAKNNSTEDAHFALLQGFTEKLASRNIDLPPFPDVYVSILNVLKDPDMSLDKLSRIVVSAPDLCVRILLMANSALLNRAGVEITDIHAAVSRLGFSAINNATIALATKDVFNIPKNSSIKNTLDSMRRASVKVAAYSYILALRANSSELKDNAMLAGLLHNVGMHYIISEAAEFPELVTDELMNEWGPGLGCALIENWGFPEEISAAVEQHTQLDREHWDEHDLADIVISATLIAQVTEAGDPDVVNWAEIPSCQLLDINGNNVMQIIDDFSDEVDSFVSALG